MTRATKLLSFIVNIEQPGTDIQVLEMLERAGLKVDREYGLVKIDAHGRQRVTRVSATEAQLEEAQSQLQFSYFPDIGVKGE